MNLDTILLYHSGELDTEESQAVERELQNPKNIEIRDFYQALQDQQDWLNPDSRLDTPNSQNTANLYLDMEAILTETEKQKSAQHASNNILRLPILVGASLAAAACLLFLLAPNGTKTKPRDRASTPQHSKFKQSITKHLEKQSDRRFSNRAKKISSGRGIHNITNPPLALARLRKLTKYEAN